jgi:protein arginine N-methyltransferase 7
MSTDPQDIIANAIQSARYNEAVVVTINDNEDGDTKNNEQQSREIVLVACLDTENGGIIWRDAAAATATATATTLSTSTTSTAANDDVGIVRHLRTKRWVLPMLNDHLRNDMYNDAIRSACRQKVAEKKSDDNTSSYDNVIRILDVGSGSGLLAMMGAKYTLDAIKNEEDQQEGKKSINAKDVRVTSVEMASAMARLARMTIKANDLDENIEVVEIHSMDEKFLLEEKADICTSELLESGLLAEGVLPSIRDAWSRHLKDDSVVIPRRARVFAVLIEGIHFDDNTNSKVNGSTVFFGPDLESFKQASGGVCLSTTAINPSPLLGRQEKSGEAAAAESNTEGILVSLHASSLLDENYNKPLMNGLTDYDDYKLVSQKLRETSNVQKHRGIRPLSDPQIVLDFDFASGLEALPPPTGQSFSKQIMVTSDGNCSGVLFWWELDLGDSADTTYSTKPIGGVFGDSNDSKNNWQDHWQQNLFLFGDGKAHKLVRGSPAQVHVSHDDTSIAFAIQGHIPIQDDISRPAQRRKLYQQESTMNRYVSSTRALQLNDVSRTRTLHDAILYALEKKGMNAPLLDLSDMGICALIAAAAGATRVTSLESSSGGMPTLAATIAQIGNNLNFQIIQAQAEHVTNSFIVGEVAEIVAAEPYFEMLEGWNLQEALNYFYLVRSMKQRGLIAPNSISVPSVAFLMAVVVECEDFCNAYGRVGDSMEKVAGFDHTPVNFFGDRYHTYDVSLPFSQYKYKALTEPFCVAKLLYEEIKIISAGEKDDGWSRTKVIRPGKCQAVIFYVDYLCRVPKEKATHRKDEIYYASITTSTASHRQVVRKLPSTVVTEADVQRGVTFFCKASFDVDTNGIEDHKFEFNIEL